MTETTKTTPAARDELAAKLAAKQAALADAEAAVSQAALGAVGSGKRDEYLAAKRKAAKLADEVEELAAAVRGLDANEDAARVAAEETDRRARVQRYIAAQEAAQAARRDMVGLMDKLIARGQEAGAAAREAQHLAQSFGIPVGFNDYSGPPYGYLREMLGAAQHEQPYQLRRAREAIMAEDWRRRPAGHRMLVLAASLGVPVSADGDGKAKAK